MVFTFSGERLSSCPLKLAIHVILANLRSECVSEGNAVLMISNFLSHCHMMPNISVYKRSSALCALFLFFVYFTVSACP